MMNRFPLAPDTGRPAAEEARRVMDAADILKVREIDLFRLAWTWWHGSPGEDRVIERAFVQYMFHRRVPPWVRQYCRDVLDKARRGKLQKLPYGVIRRRPEPPVVWPGGVYVAIVMAVAFGFILMLANATFDPVTSAPLACENGDGMRYLARLAYAIGTLSPPDCL